MKKSKFYIILVLSLLFVSFTSASATEVSSDFSMVGTWKAKYESQSIIINLKDNHKGFLTVGNLDPVEILKWEEEVEKKGKVYIGLYFYSKDKERFVKRTLRMYNAGKGFKLKAIYQSKDHLKVYNKLNIKDGKIEQDDGIMELKR